MYLAKSYPEALGYAAEQAENNGPQTLVCEHGPVESPSYCCVSREEALALDGAGVPLRPRVEVRDAGGLL